MRQGLRIVLIGTAVVVTLLVLAMVGLGIWQDVATTGPLSVGHADLSCQQCHVSVHVSRSSMNDSCLGCHREGGDSQRFVASARHAHSSAYLDIVGEHRRTPWLEATDCLGCHKGHMRSRRMMPQMAYVPDDFCDACHADIRTSGKNDAFDHSRADDFSSCQTCHRFHQQTLLPPTAGK